MLSNAATGYAVGIDAEIDEANQVSDASEYLSSGDSSVSPDQFSETESEESDA